MNWWNKAKDFLTRSRRRKEEAVDQKREIPKGEGHPGLTPVGKREKQKRRTGASAGRPSAFGVSEGNRMWAKGSPGGRRF